MSTFTSVFGVQKYFVFEHAGAARGAATAALERNNLAMLESNGVFVVARSPNVDVPREVGWLRW